MIRDWRLTAAGLLFTWYATGIGASSFLLPFELPVAPEARFLVGSTHDSAAGDR